MDYLTPNDFEVNFSENLSSFLIDKINSFEFNYQKLSAQETEKVLIDIVGVLLHSDLDKSGKERLEIWDKGWRENLDLVNQQLFNTNNLIPKYFNKYGILRFSNKFILPKSNNFEYNLLGVIQYRLFDKFLRDVDAIYEFGCGTGHNLLKVREINKGAKIVGLDWATSSQSIIKNLSENLNDKNLQAHNFNYFDPNYELEIDSNSVIFTVASLEQVGSKWTDFVNFLLEKKPKLCIHIEPIEELLDPNNLLDYLSIQYFHKRNYLKGFLTGLKKLEDMGKIKIHSAQRNHIGSLFIEGYSVVIWSPN